jgi:release factor glutamine methyltransferase
LSPTQPDDLTVGKALREAYSRLSPRSSTPRLDAEVLLAHLLGWDRARLLAHGDDPLDTLLVARFTELVERRSLGEPVAYLTGHREFYGLDLLVTPDVLVPRPETESVVEACLELLTPDGEGGVMADIGTGSGAIVVAVCKQRPNVKAYATEISGAALHVARENARRHGVHGQITFYQGDLLEPVPGPVNILAANLPYVPPGEAEPDVATWEPQVAVFGGGDDGTSLIRRFLADAPRYLLPGGRVVTETAYSQGGLVSSMARLAFPEAAVTVRRDLAGYDRIVVVQT